MNEQLANRHLGTLYLIPNLLGDTAAEEVLPAKVFRIASTLKHFLVEDAKSARRLIKQLVPDVDLRSLWMEELNEHTKKSDLERLIQPLKDGNDMAIISEAGFPCIADPGEDVVGVVQRLGGKVCPLSGPCSILLALAGSGLSGEKFQFVGYLPVDSAERKVTLGKLEKSSKEDSCSIIFMETPYRSESIFKDIVGSCSPTTLLTVAQELTTPREAIRTKSIGAWKQSPPSIQKVPVIFVLAAH